MTKKLKQKILNFGQKDLLKTCKECKFEYNPCVQKQVQIHQVIHQQHMGDIEWRDFDEAKKIKSGTLNFYSLRQECNVRTVVRNLMQFVNQQLGYDETEIMLQTDQLMVCCVSQSMVVGCVVAEPVKFAHMLLPGDENRGRYADETRVPCICGISRIWVKQTHRRQGIGRQLLDLVRKHFLFGIMLQHKEMAFSQPTRFGIQLGQSYFGTHKFLVYS
ncbi:ESCO1/2 acetyl-transferase-domain-containing protein [Gorgonomyces haynaldii]|nr:ESCO1/2 acetyl-transferase-domain-containing protein [Gorgonomyces haynaldii]